MLTPGENRAAGKWMAQLEMFHSISLELQRSECTMDDTRTLFDGLIEDYPQLAAQLGPSARIVHCPEFESGLIKLQQQEAMVQGSEEHRLMERFKKIPDRVEEIATDYASMIRLRHKRERVTTNKCYISTLFVPSTSNMVERLFCISKLLYSDLRQRMTPYHLECVLLLRYNKGYWNERTVVQVFARQAKTKEIVDAESQMISEEEISELATE